MKKRPDVLEWHIKAEDDYKAACHLSEREEDPLPDLVCYHCQQACEKYLKAFIILKGKSPPWSHDLDDLLDICIEDDSSFEAIRDIMSPLTPYAVEYRYPGVSAILEESKDALQRTEEIRKFIIEKIGFVG